MTTTVIRPGGIPQPQSWDRVVAVTLAAIAIALGIGLGIQNAQSDPSPANSNVTSYEPSAQARRLRELARDRAAYQIERALDDLRSDRIIGRR